MLKTRRRARPRGTPRGSAYPWLLAIFLIVELVYPGLAGLGFLFFYWRRLGQFRP